MDLERMDERMTKKVISLVIALIMLITCIYSVNIYAAENDNDASTALVVHTDVDGKSIVMGDANRNGYVDILDATTIQRMLAGLVDKTDFCYNICDVNRDNTVNILDVTTICQYLCGYDISESVFHMGEPIGEYKDEMASDVLSLLNEEREKEGLKPLAIDEDLVEAAKLRATEIAWGDNFSHTRPDGTKCFTTVYNLGCWALGENIARGYTSSDGVMEGWLNSAGHKKNMMCPHFDHVGIVCLKTKRANGGTSHCWVQIFGSFEPKQN